MLQMAPREWYTLAAALFVIDSTISGSLPPRRNKNETVFSKKAGFQGIQIDLAWPGLHSDMRHNLRPADNTTQRPLG